MDKFEYNQKIDQMKTLCAEEDYESAADIADSINWNKVRNVNALVNAGEIYEKVQRLEDSRDILLMAYDRSPIGKNIIFRLAEIAIRMGDMESAEEYYGEFVEIAPHDNLRYVLQYHMKKAKGADFKELIPVLEELKELEYTEEWAYELAYLYHKAGMIEKCVDACDELILWFGDGPYVERALELKMVYHPLTKAQEEKYRRYHLERQGVTTIGAEEMARAGEYVHDTVEIPQVAVNASKFNTVNLQEEIAKGIQQIMGAKKQEELDKSLDIIKKAVEEIPYLQLTKPSFEDRRAEQPYIETAEDIDGSLRANFKEMLEEDADGQMSMMTGGNAMLERQITGQMSIADVLDDFERLKRAAEAALQEADQRKLESAKARALQEAEDIMDRLNDVIPKLDAGISPKELLAEEYMQGGLDEDYEESFDPSEKEPGLPISIEEYEEEVEESQQDIQADRDDEEINPIMVAQEELADEESEVSLSAADEESMEETQEELPEIAVDEVNEDILMELAMDEDSVASSDEESSELTDAVLMNSQTLFEKASVEEELPEIQIADVMDQMRDEEFVEETFAETADEEMPEIPEEPVYEQEESVYEQEEPVYEQEEPVYEQEEPVYEQEEPVYELEEPLEMQPAQTVEDVVSVYEEKMDIVEMSEEEFVSEVDKALEEESFRLGPKDKVPMNTANLTKGLAMMEESMMQRGKTKPIPALSEIKKDILKASSVQNPYPNLWNGEEEEATLTEEQKAVFSYFVPVRGMENQLSVALEGISKHLSRKEAASTGNLIVQGGQGCGKTVLATSMIRALQKEIGKPNNKVGKINASALNKKDIQMLLKKVQGGCLIIEHAGDLSKESAVTLSLLLEQDTSGLLVILEDTSKGIKRALMQDESFARKFTETITVPIFSNDDLVSFAKSYSKELGYKIDEMAILALYNRISNIQRLDQETTLTEVKEIVDEAIDREEHGGLKKFFGTLTAKRFSDDDRIILSEKDFE